MPQLTRKLRVVEMPQRAARLLLVSFAVATLASLAACASVATADRHYRDGVALARRALGPDPTAEDRAARPGLLSRARADLERALTLSPRLEGAHTTLAAVLIAQGEDAAARRALESARPEHPDERRAAAQLGALLAAREGAWDRAVSTLRAHLEATPADRVDPGLLDLLGLALAGQLDMLPPCPPQAADAPPCPAEATRLAALEALASSQADRATLTLALGARGPTAPSSPSSPTTRLDAVLALYVGPPSPEELLARLDALPAAPEGARNLALELAALRLRATALSRLGRWPEALGALDAALALLRAPAPSAAAGALAAELGTDRALALAWVHAPRVDEARRAIAEVLASHPEHPRAQALDAVLAR